MDSALAASEKQAVTNRIYRFSRLVNGGEPMIPISTRSLGILVGMGWSNAITEVGPFKTVRQKPGTPVSKFHQCLLIEAYSILFSST